MEGCISPSIMKDSFAGYSNLGWQLFSFRTWNATFQVLFAFSFCWRICCCSDELELKTVSYFILSLFCSSALSCPVPLLFSNVLPLSLQNIVFLLFLRLFLFMEWTKSFYSTILPTSVFIHPRMTLVKFFPYLGLNSITKRI
jgi:hypothetical protein